MNLFNYLCLFLALGVFSPSTGFSAPLSLDGYLSQVEGKNENVVAGKKLSEGATLSAKEADLIYSPTLYAQTQWTTNDFRNSTFPDAYRSFFADNYTIGVKQLTPFGLSYGVSYLLSHQGFLGTIDQKTLAFVDRRFWEGTPKVDLTFSLLRNWMGAETKATEEVTRSASLISEFNTSYQVKATRAQAENAYFRVVSAQQLVHLYDNSLGDANDIYTLNNKRMRVNLGETSDVLQAEANVESSKLLLQSSRDDLRTASRDFNRLRNIDSDEVVEELVLPTIDNLTPPARAAVSDDVRAAQESAKLSAAQARLGKERNRPTLEVFGSYALNDRDLSASSTFTGSFQLGQQTTAFGLRFSMPLEFGTQSDTVKGFEMQREGAEALVGQKLFEQEVKWKELVQQLNEAKHRYNIAKSLSIIQKRKVENERTRLRQGRTTTYQTLIFNIDFNSAEATRIQAQATVLNILAQMKTFGEGRI
jgi:outer membrane protein TolC